MCLSLRMAELVVCRELCLGGASPAAGKVLSVQSVLPGAGAALPAALGCPLSSFIRKSWEVWTEKASCCHMTAASRCFKKQVCTFPALRFSSSHVLEGYHIRSIYAFPHPEALLGPPFWLPSSHVLKEHVFSEVDGSSWCSGLGCDKKYPDISRVNTRGAAAQGEQEGNPCFWVLSTRGEPIPDALPVSHVTA